MFNNVLSDEILVEKRFYIYSYWGGVNTLVKVCVKTNIGQIYKSLYFLFYTPCKVINNVQPKFRKICSCKKGGIVGQVSRISVK